MKNQFCVENLNIMGKIPYIGLRATIPQLKKYLESIEFTSFKPKFVVVHHTAAPSLAQRPDGFTEQHLLNLKNYYENVMNWNGAPHMFVDDKGFIVFQSLARPGVHAKSYNSNSWGIEMLGDYDQIREYGSMRAKEVFENTHEVLAYLCFFLKVEPKTIKFHREDPLTNKTCPGRLVDKAKFIKDVEKYYYQFTGEGAAPWTNPVFQITLGENSFVWSKTRVTNDRTIVPAREFINKLQPKNYALSKFGNNIIWMAGLKKYSVQIAEIDEQGSAWVFLREVCDKTGATFEIIRTL